MADFMDVHMVSISLPDTASDFQGDDVICNLLKAPSAAHGGAIRILAAHVTNQAATGAGTGFFLTLLNYGTSGTALVGTVAAAVGGTADPWAAGVPKTFTISDGVLEADEWLVVRKDEVNSSDPSRCVVTVHYTMGI